MTNAEKQWANCSNEEKTKWAKWANGSWMKEPLMVKWIDPVTGLICQIVRDEEGGFLSGYVGVRRGHPTYGQNFDTLKLGYKKLGAQQLVCHGGLTYSGPCIPPDDRPTDWWWFGFSCNNELDYQPGTVWEDSDVPTDDSGLVYRNMEYVRNECNSVALQLRGITNH
jgi:hypothetical protein